MDTFILIDGTGLIYRGFYAIPPYFKTKAGIQTNAVYGFASIILNIIEAHHPTYIGIAFDVKGPTFRHEAYKEYKATRIKAPDELYAQMPLCKEIIDAFGIPKFELAGFEADDLIATITEQSKKKHSLQTLIATGDFDLFQLVEENISILYPKKGFREADTIDRNAIKEKYGIYPEQVCDYKALAGDASDNIPGVRGIGPKGAVKLLLQFQNLDSIYQQLESIPEVTRKKLQNSKENAFLSKKICELDRHSPIEFDLEKCRVKSFDGNKLVREFEALEFQSLIKRFERLFPNFGKKSEQIALF